MTMTLSVNQNSNIDPLTEAKYTRIHSIFHYIIMMYLEFSRWRGVWVELGGGGGG